MIPRPLQTAGRMIYMTKGIGDLLSVGAGFTRGYCDSQGINLNHVLKDAIPVIPMCVQAGAGAMSGFVGSLSDEDNRTHGAAITTGTILGISLSFLEISLGYCAGYTIGNLNR